MSEPIVDAIDSGHDDVAKFSAFDTDTKLDILYAQNVQIIGGVNAIGGMVNAIMQMMGQVAAIGEKFASGGNPLSMLKQLMGGK